MRKEEEEEEEEKEDKGLQGGWVSIAWS